MIKNWYEYKTINWKIYVKWRTLKELAYASWQVSVQTIRNRLKDNDSWIIIEKWRVWIPEEKALY